MFCVLMALSLLTWSQEDYHKQSKSEEEQLKAQHSPLGFLNASGLFQVGRSDIRVKFVKNNGIAYKGGLREGDVILAANGKSFAKATNDINDGGKGPREDLGYAMEQSLAEKNKTLVLTVLREKQKIDLKLSMPDIAPLAKTYPYYCKRSGLTLERICDELLEMQKPDGTWGGSVQTGTAALALLGTGDKKYSKAVKRAAHSYIGKNLNTGGLPTWNYIFGGTFLCEYYLATGDFKVLDLIRNICDTPESNFRKWPSCPRHYQRTGL